MGTLVRRLLPFALVLALLALVPVGATQAAGSTARFKSPRPVERAMTDLMVMDSQGTAHLVGTTLESDLVYRSIPRRQNPTPTVVLVPHVDTNGIDSFVIAIDGADRLHMLWSRSDGSLTYQTRAADGTLSAALPVAQQLPFGLRITLAVEPSGRAHITWTDAQGNGHIARVTNGQLAAPTSIGEARIMNSAADGAGTLHFSFFRVDPTNSSLDTIFYATITLAGVVSEPLELGLHEDNGSINLVERLLVAPDGTTHLLLGTFDDSSDPGTVRYMLIRPNGSSTTAELGPYVGRTNGVLDDKGRIHIIFVAAIPHNPPTFDFDRELRYAIYKNGAFEKGRTYAKDINAIFEMAITMGPHNKPTVVWMQRDNNNKVALVARRPGSTTPRILYRTNDQIYSLLLAADPQGGAVTSWQSTEHPGGLYSSTYR